MAKIQATGPYHPEYHGDTFLPTDGNMPESFENK